MTRSECVYGGVNIEGIATRSILCIARWNLHEISSSKFVDLTEFDTIEFTPSSDNVIDNWSNVSYVNLNDGKEFFNVYNDT